ncbi:hypothetical protein P6144_07070 [Sphingomonas sp. HITSZ_GF]|uniref:hypothetical protein n=1 Tax=Sphingomonas sp. HITSZ_GF TaxID=3037247 RepID=UPI00240DC6F1|nr:hypothetical protein [Sphingomonas sp. HITSZ_GF]MDG2533399.1 hypothetical protein [Sphingomonas sp. HITSZ_GF]
MNGIDAATRSAILAARAAAGDAVRAWRGGAAYCALEAAFADCPADDPALAMDRAKALLDDGGWAEALLAPLVAALAVDPLFEPPLRVNRDAMRIGAVLFDCPAVSIAACRTSAEAMRRLPAPTSISFSGRLAVTRYVRAGGALLRRWHADPAGPEFRADTAPPCHEAGALRLFDGAVHAIDGHREAQLVAGAMQDVVTLVATIRAGAAPLMREHAIADGRLLRVASGDERASRSEMLLAFLRLAGRADAHERFEDATHDPAFHLRWAAMREWLALDARAALPRLAAMATRDPHAEIRSAATRMLTVVRARLEAPCPG